MKIRSIALIGAAAIPFLSGCISTPITLSSAGPDPISRATPGSRGCLQVFTATETRTVEAEVAITDYHAYFHPHVGYDINDESGKIVKFVPNHASDMDESPDQVKLPAGKYTVLAESAGSGLVTVPVVIEDGKTTIVHLD
jgi:hypothetical protein